MKNETTIKTIFLEPHKINIHIVRPDLSNYQQDDQGRELWWYGSDPPNGIPTPEVFINTIQQRRMRNIPPPWAAVVKDVGGKGCWICTDPIGLQHLFIRNIGKDIIIGADALEIASFAPVHIDPIGSYELIARGNPQGGRTLFSEVKCLSPATLIQIESPLKKVTYWSPPPPRPIDQTMAIDLYANAVTDAVSRHYHEDDAQELTAGRDSMMIIAALISKGIHVRTWTLGRHGDPDMVGAQARASHFDVPHQAVYTELLQNIYPGEAMQLAKTYLKASNGLANILEYWHLPWVLKRVNAKGSITGVGGEVFRGFYYEWTGKGRLPRSLGEWFLLHGKIRREMPFAHPFINKNVSKKGDEIIRQDLRTALKSSNNYWHNLDCYYLMHRMHHFAGTTFSATGRWRTVRMPLFDPSVIDCLQFIPIELRGWSSGLVRGVTKRLLKSKPLENKISDSYETLRYRTIRLLKRSKQLRGLLIGDYRELLGRLILNSKEAGSLLDINEMVTIDLYNIKILKQFIDRVKGGNPIPISLGAVLTIELAARELGSAFRGINKSNLI